MERRVVVNVASVHNIQVIEESETMPSFTQHNSPVLLPDVRVNHNFISNPSIYTYKCRSATKTTTLHNMVQHGTLANISSTNVRTYKAQIRIMHLLTHTDRL